jgi:putative ABC transport system substrate-binding protein
VAFVHSSIPVDQLLESGGSPARWVPQFFEELRRLGDFEGIGGNLQVDRYSGEGHPERYNGLARRVINSRPDLIITVAPLIPAFRALTTTIPIAGFFADPTRLGFVESLARPGGNITGVSIDAGVEIYGKQLQLLKEAVPQAVKVGYLATNRVWNTPIAQAAREASSSLGMSLIGMVVPEVTISQLRRAFAETAGKALDAIVVSPAGEFLGSISTITHIVGRRELPAMYPYREYIEGGGLMAYAPELSEPARQLANQVHQILNRKTPSEIPVFQATKFELLLNLQAARSLGISFSPALLARADEIIE